MNNLDKLNKIEEKVNSKFSKIKFSNPNMSIKVDSGFNRINVSVEENVERWSKEIVQITFEIRYNSEPTINFNYGSGGWNSGTTKTQLEIMANAFDTAKKIAEIFENQSDYFINLLNESRTLRNKLDDEYNQKRKQEDEKNYKMTIAGMNKLVKDKKISRIFTIETLDAILSNKPSIALSVVVVNNHNIVLISRVKFEKYVDKKTVYYMNNKRISVKNLSDGLMNNYYFEPLSQIESSQRSVSFSTFEEFNNYIKI